MIDKMKKNRAAIVRLRKNVAPVKAVGNRHFCEGRNLDERFGIESNV
jgi:hypothetical protein